MVPSRKHVASTCLRDGMFALPSAPTTSSSSSGSGRTVSVHAVPSAQALAVARGRMCASKCDACRAPCVRRSGLLRLGRLSVEWVGRASNSGPCELYRVVIHHIPTPSALGCGAAVCGARGRDRAKSYLYTIVCTPCTTATLRRHRRGARVLLAVCSCAVRTGDGGRSTTALWPSTMGTRNGATGARSRLFAGVQRAVGGFW